MSAGNEAKPASDLRVVGSGRMCWFFYCQLCVIYFCERYLYFLWNRKQPGVVHCCGVWRPREFDGHLDHNNTNSKRAQAVKNQIRYGFRLVRTSFSPTVITLTVGVICNFIFFESQNQASFDTTCFWRWPLVVILTLAFGIHKTKKGRFRNTKSKCQYDAFFKILKASHISIRRFFWGRVSVSD